MTDVFTKALLRVAVFGNDEDGTTAMEYAIIAGLLSIAIAAIVTDVGSVVVKLFASARDSF